MAMGGHKPKIAESFSAQTMDTTTEMGIIVSGTTVYGTRLPGYQITLVEGDCLIPFIKKLGKHGLFSVPAPSQHPRGVRRGFLLDFQDSAADAVFVFVRQQQLRKT
jgi:hypothetical protein